MKKQTLVRIARVFVLAMVLFIVTACHPDDGTDGNIAAPSNLYLIGATSDSVTIGWTEVAGAVSYKVYRSISSGGQYEWVNKEVRTAGNKYTNSGLSPSATFFYKVSAVGSDGLESPQSDYIQTSTEGLPSPEPVWVLDTTKNSIMITWTSVSGAAKYEIWWCLTPEGQYNRLGEKVAPPYTHDGLKPATSYYYKVKSLGNNGLSSGLSSYVKGTTKAEGDDNTSIVAPPPPAAPVVTAGDGQLTVSWTAVDGATAYEVWYGITNGFALAGQYGSDVSGVTVTISDLINGTPYYVWVKAKNGAGTSDFSPMANGTPLASVVAPPPPAAPVITAGNGQLTVSWTAVDGATAYEVWYGATNNSATATRHGADVTGLSATISGLTNGTTCYVWVKAKNAAGTSGFSPLASGAPIAQSVTSDTMVLIPAGTFTMGSPTTEAYRSSDEIQHQVRVSGFYMSKYEVTQAEWVAVMGTNPSHSKGDKLPVETVSWYEVVEYCNKLSQKEGLTPVYTISGTNVTWNRNANGYRLPTEAEWEYACRAGTTTPYSSGSSVDSAGWYGSNSGSQTQEVGTKQANAWGLYDMHGNVWEWCWDWYGNYGSGDQTDPTGASSGSYRVLRGGSWDDFGQNLRSANRYNSTPSNRNINLGFRLLRPSL